MSTTIQIQSLSAENADGYGCMVTCVRQGKHQEFKYFEDESDASDYVAGLIGAIFHERREEARRKIARTIDQLSTLQKAAGS